MQVDYSVVLIVVVAVVVNYSQFDRYPVNYS